MKVNTTPAGVAKRVKWVTQFLEELLKETIFKSTNELLIFLSMNKESFESLQKEIAKSPGPKVVSEIPHPGGRANLSVTGKKTALAANINKYCSEALSLYAKFKSTNLKIVDAMRNVSSLLKSQAEICKNISNANVAIKCVEMAKAWDLLKSLNLNQSEHLSMQADLEKESMRNLIKRLKQHAASLNDV